MIEKAKLINEVAKKCKISIDKATKAYETILKESPTFRKHKLKSGVTVKEVAVAVPGKTKIKSVKLTKKVPTPAIKTVEKLVKVPVKNNIAVYKREQKIKVVEVIKEVPVIQVKEVIKEVVKEVPVIQIQEVVKIKTVKQKVPVTVIKEVIKEIKVPVPVIKEVVKVVKVPAKPIIQTAQKIKLKTVKVKVPVAKVKEVVKKVEVIKEVPVTLVKEVEVLKEVIKKVPTPIYKTKTELKKVEVIQEVPVVVEKVKIKEVKVKEKVPVVAWKEINNIREVVKEVEIIKEVPVEVIKEVEVIKSFDMKNLQKMLGKMKTVESSRKVIGTTKTSGEATVVDRRELGTGVKATKVTGTATKVSGKTKKSSGTTTTKKVAAKKTTAKKATAKKGTAKKSSGKDDLTKIEGIGPKIAGLMNAGGIHTFQELADAKFGKLKKILTDAGPRYQMHDPTSWPQQSGLAAKGKWEELKTLQDKLDGGK